MTSGRRGWLWDQLALRQAQRVVWNWGGCEPVNSVRPERRREAPESKGQSAKHMGPVGTGSAGASTGSARTGSTLGSNSDRPCQREREDWALAHLGLLPGRARARVRRARERLGRAGPLRRGDGGE